MLGYQFFLAACLLASSIAGIVAVVTEKGTAPPNLAFGWALVHACLFGGALILTYDWVRTGSLLILLGLLIACLCFRPTIAKVRMLLTASRQF